MLNTLKEYMHVIVIALCIATMVSQCTTCSRVATVGTQVEEQQHRTDSLMIIYSNQSTATLEYMKGLETKVDSAIYGGANKKPQQNYIVIKK